MNQTSCSSRSVAVVIPCYNDTAGLRVTLAAVRAAAPPGESWQVMVIDDGSADGDDLRVAMSEFATWGGKLERLTHRRRRGYGAALKTGLAHTSAEIVAIIDADGSYPADQLRSLIGAAEACDMAVGARTGASVHRPPLRRLPKWLLNRYAAWLIGEPIPDLNSGMRAFRRSAALPLLPLVTVHGAGRSDGAG